MLINIRLMCELSFTVFPKPAVSENNKLIVLKNPDDENMETNNFQFFIIAFNE